MRELNPHLCRMKVTFGSLVITAGICGVLSFAFLATSLGTEYWYIIEMNPVNTSDFENMSSHSGLWSINEAWSCCCLVASVDWSAPWHGAPSSSPAQPPSSSSAVGPEGLAYIHTSFGWSLGLAWLSYGLELLTGVLLLVAARMAKLQQSSPAMA
ncbi:hypothetical protein FQN60_003351 [Etheostoma spectabile]|uniref:Transmembrane protein 235 n=1 Tax=Etheostoma spectabile TaxID=54343 RepID=A0A5J5CN27_9PERO|nr:hypothetical protein FQN60_003351 [Etheostoma spectabile]